MIIKTIYGCRRKTSMYYWKSVETLNKKKTLKKDTLTSITNKPSTSFYKPLWHTDFSFSLFYRFLFVVPDLYTCFTERQCKLQTQSTPYSLLDYILNNPTN